MEYDLDKIDDCTLALLYLVVCERDENYGTRAWKGFEWETLARLHEKGFIGNPKGKARSVVMSEAGYRKAEELCLRLFGKTGGDGET